MARTTAHPMRCVKLTLPCPERARKPLITLRLTSSNFAGTLRKLVAVGTSRLACMFRTIAAPAPRIGLPLSSAACFPPPSAFASPDLADLADVACLADLSPFACLADLSRADLACLSPFACVSPSAVVSDVAAVAGFADDCSESAPSSVGGGAIRARRGSGRGQIVTRGAMGGGDRPDPRRRRGGGCHRRGLGRVVGEELLPLFADRLGIAH